MQSASIHSFNELVGEFVWKMNQFKMENKKETEIGGKNKDFEGNKQKF